MRSLFKIMLFVLIGLLGCSLFPDDAEASGGRARFFGRNVQVQRIRIVQQPQVIRQRVFLQQQAFVPQRVFVQQVVPAYPVQVQSFSTFAAPTCFQPSFQSSFQSSFGFNSFSGCW